MAPNDLVEGQVALATEPVLRPLYEESSQYRHWRFSEPTLIRMRKQLNERAVKVVRANVEAEKAAAASLPQREEGVKANPIDLSTIPYLSVDDEQSLVAYYISTVPRTCSGFGFPEVVEATTMSFLKRFYLWNTCMDYHPRKIMPTCLFLALKTENHLVPIDAFISRFSKLNAAEILQLEFLVAQSLKFEFSVWHTHKALRGFWLDLQAIPDMSIPDLTKALATSLAHVKTSRLLDLELVYTHSQIGLACLHLASPALASTYVQSKVGRSASAPGLDAPLGPTGPAAASDLPEDLLELCRTIGSAILEQERSKTDMDRVKEVDRRLRLCSNPEKIPGSALFQKRAAETEREEASKRAKKASQAAAAKKADADIFGGDLVVVPFAATAQDDGEGGGEFGAEGQARLEDLGPRGRLDGDYGDE